MVQRRRALVNRPSEAGGGGRPLDDLAALQLLDGEAAFGGAVGAEAEDAVDPGKALRLGQAHRIEDHRLADRFGLPGQHGGERRAVVA